MKQRDKAYIVTIAILLFFVIFFHLRSERHSAESKLKDSVIAEKNDVIHYHVNQQGKILAEKHAAEIHSKDLEKMYPQVYAELEKSFDIKIKNLKAYIKNEFSAQGEGTGSIVNNYVYDSATKRTIRFRDFNMDDGYLTFHTRVYDSLQSSLYQYTYSDTSQTAISSKKKWLLGKESLYATTMFSNPNAKITGTTNILVKNYRDKRWAVIVGAGFDPIQMRPSAIVGVGYTLFKF